MASLELHTCSRPCPADLGEKVIGGFQDVLPSLLLALLVQLEVAHFRLLKIDGS